MRGTFAEHVKQYAYGEALLVLPNRFLLQSEQQKGTVRAVNMDYLPNEILRANRRDRFEMLSRRSQEIIVKKLIDDKKKAGQLKYLLNIADADSFAKIVTGFIGELSVPVLLPRSLLKLCLPGKERTATGLKMKRLQAFILIIEKYLKKIIGMILMACTAWQLLNYKRLAVLFPGKLFF